MLIYILFIPIDFLPLPSMHANPEHSCAMCSLEQVSLGFFFFLTTSLGIVEVRSGGKGACSDSAFIISAVYALYQLVIREINWLCAISTGYTRDQLVMRSISCLSVESAVFVLDFLFMHRSSCLCARSSVYVLEQLFMRSINWLYERSTGYALDKLFTR